MSESKLPSSYFACLGPALSYSHRALDTYVSGELGVKDFFSEKPLHLSKSISQVFDEVKPGAGVLGFVPLENSIEGSVNETLDQLLVHRKGIHISDSFLFPINHALGIPKGKDANSITAIYSHPQALGQCRKNIAKSFPGAVPCAVSSTSAALELVKSQNLDGAAVIAHPETLLKEEFEILNRSIGDFDNNETRFVVLAPGKASFSTEAPAIDPKKARFVTALVVNPGKDRRGLLHEILELISVRFGVNLCSINSRPDPSNNGYVFYLELEGHPSSDNLKNCLKELERFADVVTGDTVEISVFGSYQKSVAPKPDAPSVGIIGGKGRMGKLLKRAFEERGCRVYVSDKAAKDKNKYVSVQELVKNSEVIVLSVPMDGMESICKEISPHLSADKVVVENCSVKESALPLIESSLPESVEILGVHTLFGNSIESLEGQNVIVTRTERSGKKAKLVEEIFYRTGARITHLSSEHHDAHAALMQSLVHAVTITYGAVLSDSGITKEDHHNFSTPNSRALFYAIKRIASLSDELITGLQLHNSQAQEIREAFLELFSKTTHELSKEDTELLLESIKKCRKLVN